jgi:ubiquinone/menaquinone biosynthesis C-methylase UbiE
MNTIPDTYDLARDRDMAVRAEEYEEAAWALAGIVPGARVADIGCGPGSILVQLARLVAPDGMVVGVEPAAEVRDAATALLDIEAVTNALVVEGTVSRTGLEPASFDVVMQRHVLLYHGGHEQVIVSHLASLVRPGGVLYLLETDLDGVRIQNAHPDIHDLWERWRELMRRRGNDASIGLRLRELVQSAGLKVTDIDACFDVVELTPELRPPSWAARDALVDAGLATTADVARWDNAFVRLSHEPEPPVAYVPIYRVVARWA